MGIRGGALYARGFVAPVPTSSSSAAGWRAPASRPRQWPGGVAARRVCRPASRLRFEIALRAMAAQSAEGRDQSVAVCGSPRAAERAVGTPSGRRRAVAVSRAVRRRQAGGPRPDAGGKPVSAGTSLDQPQCMGRTLPLRFCNRWHVVRMRVKRLGCCRGGCSRQSGETPKAMGRRREAGALITPVPFSPIRSS